MKNGWFLLIVFLMVIAGCGYKGTGSDDTFKEDRDQKIIQVIPEKPVRIELRRNTRGAYSWTLKGEKAERIIATDKKLRAYIKEMNK
jgi:predicted secreted protein